MSNSILRVFPSLDNPHKGQIFWQDRYYTCALGKNGVISGAEKTEGDGYTPAGLYPFRFLYYRPDRVERPSAHIETRPLAPKDGWCDEPSDKYYNCPVALPYKARHEALWRDDECYDLLAVIGHNDFPSNPSRGSAIFIHVARENYAPTRGCIALAKDDLLEICKSITPNSIVRVHLPTKH